MMELPSMTMSFMKGPPAVRHTGHKISGYSIPAFSVPYKRKARRTPLRPGRLLPFSLPLIIKAVKKFPPPAPSPLRRVQPQGHIGPRRQLQRQGTAPPRPLKGEVVGSRLQAAENHPAAAGTSGPAAASLIRAQRQPVPKAWTANQHTNAAPSISGHRAEILTLLLLSPQAEGDAGNYCSSLALTRYWPPVTPPKRYFPSALVLVVAIRVSTAVAPVPVT